MAKKETQDSGKEKSKAIAEAAAGSDSGSALRPIQSEADALGLIEREYKATAPEGVKGAHVTEDGMVFWANSSGSAYNHAVRNNLKLFSVTWD